MSDQDRISPYNISTISVQYQYNISTISVQYQYNIRLASDENKEKYQTGDYKLIQYQILQSNITRTV